MRRISLAALSPYYWTLQTLGIFPEQKTLRTSLTPVIICFPSYLREGDTGQLKHAQTDFQIVFIQEPFSPLTKGCFVLFSHVNPCGLCNNFCIWTALYCLTCIIHIVYMDLITYSGLCVCGYHIVASLCVVFEISLHFDAMTIKAWNWNWSQMAIVIKNKNKSSLMLHSLLLITAKASLVFPCFLQNKTLAGDTMTLLTRSVSLIKIAYFSGFNKSAKYLTLF